MTAAPAPSSLRRPAGQGGSGSSRGSGLIRLDRVGCFIVGSAFGAVCALNACAWAGHQASCAQQTQQRSLVQALNVARSKLEQAVANASHWRDAPVLVPTEVPRPTERTSETNDVFLLGLVMHVARAHDYLSETLGALAQSELRDAETVVGSRVALLVYDASATPSPAFSAAKRKFRSFDFASGDQTGAPQKSTAAKQSRDVASALGEAVRRYRFRNVMLLEDDWLPCRGLLSSIVLAFEAASRSFDDVAAVRVSYGLNGVIVPRRGVEDFARFVVSHAPALPPDHALTQWAQKRGTLVTFRHNAFVHAGAVSSIGNSGQRWNTACYELLYDWLEIESEAFQVSTCAHDVISPCRPATSNPQPKRKAKKFKCDVALQDLPAYLASGRLGTCLKDAIPASSSLLARSILP